MGLADALVVRRWYPKREIVAVANRAYASLKRLERCRPERKFKTQALLCTDLEADPKKILCWFAMRWQLEVTFQEMRTSSFETQRQWSELAIRRTTPALMGLFSLITLFAHGRMVQASCVFRRQAGWYHSLIRPSQMRSR